MSWFSCCSLQRSRFVFVERPRKLIFLEAWFQLWNVEADLWWFGHQYLSILLVPQLLPMVELLPVTVDILGNQVHPVSGCCFLLTMQFFKMTVCHYTQLEVLSCFAGHEDAIQHLSWPPQSPGESIIEPLLSVVGSSVISRFLPPSHSSSSVIFLSE
jgi:hypothetical protein